MRTEQITAKALKKMDDDKYLLSIVVAKRAEQLANGATPFVKADNREKFTDIALKEIAEGKVGLESITDIK
ncbi:MAG: DNA-directed RNA polymerase subunit omega [Sulfurospirillum sp.]